MTKPADIRNTIDKKIELLAKTKKDIMEELNVWEEQSIQKIKTHVADQRKFLELHCGTRKGYLEGERKRLVNEATASDKKKEIEKLERLLEECKALKANLPVINKYEKSVPCIKISTEEELQSKHSGENGSQQTAVVEVNDNLTNNGRNGSRRPSVISTTANIQPANEQPPESQTPNNNELAAADNTTIQSGVENVSEMEDKCPLCFMLFPKTMSKDERMLHVNEHYSD